MRVTGNMQFFPSLNNLYSSAIRQQMPNADKGREELSPIRKPRISGMQYKGNINYLTNTVILEFQFHYFNSKK